MTKKIDLGDFLTRPRFDPGTPAVRDSSWPRISIVTPSFNQARFLEKTILSVLNQDYPNLEYIIIDGGSLDGSVEIIKKYERRLAWWVSEPDRGQSAAINKGFAASSGDLLAWLNSDDAYMPGTLQVAGRVFAARPEIDLLYGDTLLIDQNDVLLRELKEVRFSKRALVHGAVNLVQPNALWRRQAFFQAGALRTDYHYCLDVDLWLRMIGCGSRFYHVRRPFALYRLHTDAKSVARPDLTAEELRRLNKEVLGWEISRFPHNVIRLLCHGRRLALLLAQGDLKYGLRGLAGHLIGNKYF